MKLFFNWNLDVWRFGGSLPKLSGEALKDDANAAYTTKTTAEDVEMLCTTAAGIPEMSGHKMEKQKPYEDVSSSR